MVVRGVVSSPDGNMLSTVWAPLRASTFSRSGTLPTLPLYMYRNYAKKAKKSQRLNVGQEDHSVMDFDKLRSSMCAAVNALKWEYSNTVITRLTPAALDRVTIAVDGSNLPLKEVAQIGMPNPQMLLINMTSYPEAYGSEAQHNDKPQCSQTDFLVWAVESAVQALRDTALNLNPIAEKNIIKIPLPKMTKELREKLVKMAKSHAERTKVGIRRVRQKSISEARRSKDDVSEDTIYRIEKHIQHVTDEHIKAVDELLKAKSTEVMKS